MLLLRFGENTASARVACISCPADAQHIVALHAGLEMTRCKALLGQLTSLLEDTAAALDSWYLYLVVASCFG